MFGSMYIYKKCKDLNFKFQSSKSPAPCGHFSDGLEVNINYKPPCARIYRPSFHENKPKTLVFT
jgi:hypothetical protein